jgi:hypothetical protein
MSTTPRGVPVHPSLAASTSATPLGTAPNAGVGRPSPGGRSGMMIPTMAPPDLVEVSAAAAEVLLPHRCAAADLDAPIPYRLGPRGRERLASGESVPVTARCRRCDARVFLSLVDPAARATRRAAARSDPTALRRPPPARDLRTGQPLQAPRQRVVRPPSPAAAAAAACPACGAIPDAYGLCRCSM